MSHSLAAIPLCGLWLLVLGCAPTGSDAEVSSVAVSAVLAEGPEPTLASPERLGPCQRGAQGPTWTHAGEVAREVPRNLYGLSRVEKAGLPVFDPSTSAWHASANGSIVRVDRDRLTVIADGIQGVDIDVRAELGLAVSREPDDTIVVHRFGEGATEREVLFTGAAFFRPRLSPDGDAVVVSESRVGGGSIWLKRRDGSARELTRGVSPGWHPDGRHVVFARVAHDGQTIVSSALWMVDTTTGEERLVGGTSIPGVEPAISPDGKMIAFMDGRSREVYLARLDDPFEGGAR